MENFYLNKSNVFNLPKEIDFSIEMIQVSIIEQTKGVDKISDLLSQNIDVDKGILYDDKLTINFIYKSFLSLDNNSISISNITKCSIILFYLQLILFNEYVKNVHKNLLTLSEYQIRYDNFLNEFLNLNVDVDENDFIDAELKICNDVLIELDKQIYSSITTNQILEKNIPCDFKVKLIYSLNKRIKFLNDKYNFEPSFNSDIFTSKNSEDLYKFLKTNYNNSKDNRFYYIYYFLLKHKHINISLQKFTQFVFNVDKKNLRGSNSLNYNDQMQLLKELETEYCLNK